MTRKAVLQALSAVVEPDRGHDIARLGLVRDLSVADSAVSFTLHVGAPGTAFARQAPELCKNAIQAALGADIAVDIRVVTKGPSSESVKLGAQHMIAIASGKGGVGKSTVAVNLAVALAKQGFRTGLVDTDIYGPSIPVMLGVDGEKPRVNERRKIVPLQKYGVHLLSMGLLVDATQAVIWRGPMVSNAVRQFLNDAEWGELDFLLLDLPPGTGDIQLTIVQTVTLTGAVIVSTPQHVALADARKGVAMFEKVNVPVLGIVENMAWFTPPDLPGRKYYLFGEGGARALAEETGTPFLCAVPLEQGLRESGDDGRPIMIGAPESASAAAFQEAATRIVAAVARADEERSPSPVIDYK